MTALALREWRVVCDLIARGDVSLIVRKGGIDEKVFVVDQPGFWLLPTWEHQNAADLAEWARDSLAAADEARRSDDVVELSVYAEVCARWDLRSEAELDAVVDLQPWSAAYARSRLHWRPTKPLVALLLRARQAPGLNEVAASELVAGCRSFVDLPRSIAVPDVAPVVDNAALQRIRVDIDQGLRRVGATA